ncbi:MAG: tetratricopeptide repeat protein, partial [Phycisphaerae bacterium]
LHYLLARSALDDGDDGQAVCELRIALACPNITEKPDIRALALHRLGQTLTREGYLVAALDAYERFEQTVAGLADREDADSELTTLLQVTGGSSGRARSAIHERLGQFGQAAEALSQSLAVQPAAPQDHKKLIELLSRAGSYAQALDKVRALLVEDPTAVDLLLDVHRRAGHPQAALDDLAELSAQHPDDVQHMLNYVTGLERLGESDRARAQLEGFAARHPKHVALYWRLFDLDVARQAWGQAVASAAQAMRQDPSVAPIARAKMLELAEPHALALLDAQGDRPAADASTAFLLGCLANQWGHYGQADVQLQQAVVLAPELRIAQIELAALRIAQFRWTDALSLLDALDENATTEARVELLRGDAHRGLDHRAEAIGHYKSAARLSPQDARPLQALADLYERAGETLRAIRQRKAVLEVDPLDQASREALFGLYFRSGDREEATRQLHELRSRSASPHRIARCVALLENDPRNPDMAQFRRTLQQAMDAAGPDAESLTFIGITYLDDGEYEQALATLKRAADLAPDDSDTLLALEYAYRMSLQFDRAVQTLRTLLQRYPNRTEWINGLVSVLVTDQQFDEALKIVRRQLARDDLTDAQRIAYRNNLLEILGLARRFDEQIQTLEGWLAAAPDDARLRAPLVQAYFAADKHADILERLQTWYRQTPTDADLRGQLVDALIRAGRGARACQIVLDALNDDPDDDRLQLLLVSTLGEAGRHDDALELANNCLLLARNRLAYQWQMRNVYDDAGRHEEAVKLLGEMLEEMAQAGDRSEALGGDVLRQVLAGHLIQAKRFDQAQVKLTRWIERSPGIDAKFQYLRLLSQCRQERGQKEQALEALEQAYDLKPNDAGINNDLAYSWADSGINLDEAEKRLRFAVAQEPRVDAYLDSLGWVLYKKGQFAEAVKWLTRSLVAGAGEDPVIHNHLGDALWRAGKSEQAREHWIEAQQRAEKRLENESTLNRPEYESVLESTRQKIQQVEQGEPPDVAPLGRDAAPTSTSQAQHPTQAGDAIKPRA